MNTLIDKSIPPSQLSTLSWLHLDASPSKNNTATGRSTASRFVHWLRLMHLWKAKEQAEVGQPLPANRSDERKPPPVRELCF